MYEPVDQTGKRGYCSFLLRMWQEEPNDSPGQKILLENPHTHEMVTFTSFNDLLDFLRAINSKNELDGGIQK